MNSKIKVFTSIVIIIAMLITGTLAWVNFSQHMLNEFEGGPGDPSGGGTGHDDFDDPDKDVYVENWGETTIYVRIRLDEYMEIGEGAGLKAIELQSNGTTTPNPNNKAQSLIAGADINDMETWSPHIPDGQVEICDTPADFHEYWDWEMGGWKYYMPAPEDKRTDPAYIDQNTNEYDGTEDGVKRTLDSEVITMQEWIARGKPIGNYWVIDTDGWAYWAAPLRPGQTTGLLLNAVNRIFEPEDSYYYAINVIVQMATKFGDLNYKNFYDDTDKDHKATDEGKDLLDTITKEDKASVPATNVSINGGDKDIYVGDTYKPGCVIEPANSTDKPIWSSSDNSIATVDKNGKITGVGEGEVTITVTVGNKTDSITITVSEKPQEPIPATDITIVGGDKQMTVGDEDTLTYTITPENSTDKPVWTSSDNSVVTVDEDGNITAIGEGEATITITAGDKTDSITITVSERPQEPIPVTDITIVGGDKQMTVGDEDTLTYTIIPANSTDKPVWSSSDDSIVIVDEDGNITAIGEGEVTITITAGDKTDSITITVVPSEDPLLDTKNGEGPYDTQFSDTDNNLNYALVCAIKSEDFENIKMNQEGSIKLSAILSGSNYTGINVFAVESKYQGHFRIDQDKDGDLAVVYDYIPEQSVWHSLKPNKPVIEDVKLMLTKDGYQNTPVYVTLRYNGSLYTEG